MRYVTRAEWGAQYAQGSAAMPRPRVGVTCHWEGPGQGNFPHSRCARKVRAIERFHAVTRGWAGIAYNLLVCPHGYVFEGRGPYKRSAANGVSNIGGNDHWYAVCYMGGQGDPFTRAGKRGVTDAIHHLRRTGGAGARVNGHRDHHPTQCPGNAIYRWLEAKDFNAYKEPSMRNFLKAKVRNFKKQGGRERRYWDWFMRLFNQNRRSHNWDKETVRTVRRIEKKIDRLLDDGPGA